MMRIGITYDLRSEYLAAGYSEEETAEFDSGETIAAIDGALVGLGHSTDRIGNVRALAARLVAGDRWDLVFNICEGLRGFGREAQVPALLEAYGIPYTFSDTLTSALTLHKGLTKNVLRDNGVATPDFAVVESAAQIAAIDLPLPLFAKPVAEGTGKGIDGGSRITSRARLGSVCRRLLQRYRQPVLVERFLPGREFTVSLLGTGAQTRVLGTLEVEICGSDEPGVYTFLNKEECETRVRYSLAEASPMLHRVETLALAAWRCMGCRDAGRVDLRLDEQGSPQVMELNPLAGLHPSHSDLPMLCTRIGMSYGELIRGIVESAAKRVTQAERRPARRRTAVRA